jgi:signal transduction histidine kinase
VRLAGITPLVVVNFLGTLVVETSATVVRGVFLLAFIVPAVALCLSVFHYGIFDSTPAAGTLGERAIPRETDDLVFVADHDDRIIKTNETAAATLGISRTESLGEPLSSVVAYDVAELADSETVELETTVGNRQFDPQVTAFTDQHDRQLGTLLSLRDVTDRELRKQRLEVLNRVLRHNLRNKVDVIKSNAEAVSEGPDGEFTDTIVDAADELAALSAKARSTDQLLSRRTADSTVDLAARIRELTDRETDVSVTLDLPESATLATDREALGAALRSAIENAFEYAESSVTVSVEERPESWRVVVSDDGPGIPDSELAAIDDGTETQFQHATGLGLWQLRWGVTRLNGELAVDTTDGTVVRMTIPVRST